MNKDDIFDDNKHDEDGTTRTMMMLWTSIDDHFTQKDNN